MAASQAAKQVLRLPPLPRPADLLRLYRLRALKQLSQNFLLDPRICTKLVKCAGKLQGSHVIEVGPGPGSLTAPILKGGASCAVIEKDGRFLPALEDLANATDNKLKVIHGDVLTYPIESLIPDGFSTPWEEKSPNVYLIGNLPFSISTILLVNWLKMISQRSGPWQHGRIPMVLTFQKEVSTRINAKDIHPEKCRLSVLSQGYCETRECFTIVGGSFVPPPNVDVGVVRLLPRITPVFNQKFDLVEKVLRCMFNAKRKTLKRELRNLFPRSIWDEISGEFIEQCDLDPAVDVVLLRPIDFSKICDVYAKYCSEIDGLYEYNYRAPYNQRESAGQTLKKQALWRNSDD